MRAIEGVREVTHANWFGGYYQDPSNFLIVFAVEPASYIDVYRNEFDFRPSCCRPSSETAPARWSARRWRTLWLEAWRSRPDRQQYLHARRSGGQTWDFTIVGIFKGKAEPVDTNFMMFQYDYFDETRSFGKD